MSRRSLSLGSLLAAAFVVVGCHELPTAPETSTLSPSAAALARGKASAGGSFVRTLPVLPSSLAPISTVFGEVGTRAINPGDYVCSGSTPLIDWLNADLTRTLNVEAPLLIAMYQRYADLIPTYEALYFQTSATPQYFGYNGEFTKVMTKTERDVKRFWDIPSSEIQVLAMHGTMLLDQERTYQTYRLLGFPEATARAYAKTVAEALAASTTMNGGNYAFWTFNAVSFRDEGYPDKIVMGDGILEAYAAIGYGDIAPQAIFAHEFAHQIQFENEYFEDLGEVTQPEATRYTELMADAMAGYYLTHKRGAALNDKRVAQFLQVFYQTGDCQFANPGHHGTPNQRMAAAEFGFRLADEAQKQGHILTSEEFHSLFLAYYPTLIAPDAT
ncbi:MAG TPA: hypothetical protein VKA54_14650 [Gemmatimonadaceae bacterium]|nr:hypothetical protein [Gemmatimonadaceae bacterium]